MVNYKLGKVYKLKSIHSDDEYIGSTTKKYLSQRLTAHVASYNSYKNGKTNYVTSFKIIEMGDYQISLLESCPCESKDELLVRERYWIENAANCINKVIPGRSKAQRYEANKETIAARYQANKENVLAKVKQYNNANKEKIKAKRSEQVICDCGSTHSKGEMTAHKNTKKHLAYIASVS